MMNNLMVPSKMTIFNFANFARVHARDTVHARVLVSRPPNAIKRTDRHLHCKQKRTFAYQKRIYLRRGTMFSLDLKGILRCIHSSDEGGLLIGHTDVLSRTEEHEGQIEVS